MSDTPRTQKARGFHDLETAVAAKEMEKLERELNAAKTALSGRTVSCSNCNALAVENAAMREVIKEAHEALFEITSVGREYYDMDMGPNGAESLAQADVALTKLQPYLK